VPDQNVCESKVYTVVEDRPVEVERRTRVLEHHKFEKTFVVQTRCVAERELADQNTVGLDLHSIQNMKPTIQPYKTINYNKDRGFT
jgi:hypothetical protein